MRMPDEAIEVLREYKETHQEFWKTLHECKGESCEESPVLRMPSRLKRETPVFPVNRP